MNFEECSKQNTNNCKQHEKNIDENNCSCKEKKVQSKKVSSDHSSSEDNASSDINSNKAETLTLNCGDQSDNKNSISDIESNKFIPNENDFQMLKKQLNDLKAENVNLKRDLQEAHQQRTNDNLKYLADFDNFKKRITVQTNREIKYALTDFIKNILIPLEQFEKVLEMPKVDDSVKSFLLGFKMIHKQVKDILQKEGVEEIKALGVKFDPNFHYALEKISDLKQPNGINVLVLQKGFLYKDLVIKPAMVKVNEWSDKNND
ncbi:MULTISPECIES: nucleotide exchange factor GrpE [Candidatus Phytoplasma]|nr:MULTISPECIES: nucleotide exchange factor GrpE [Phytoplasma]QLL37006.1 molecular chaperone GrpE (heat shock protein) ['Echinacea purpurea' witches'-broom phytoplasma]WEX20275.1 MAG: molecular chaperone GrpE (heat shock protein) [Candidatus Phytoplasma aurantifolia]WKV64256.1 MAG: molecular chaperone GrpE (heat shock protein) [Candidatus Phytoplasma australasiaticum]EMR14707.1 molecular chaperone GrpE (heat shock protein) [Peanut witches'-broom phytoplasma NTU2011]MDO8052728.1 nucleotide exch